MSEKKVQNPEVSPSAVLAAEFDRSQLGEKTRVHGLAKLLGLASRDLVVALDSIGLVKVAQSSLSREEAGKLLDVLAQPVAGAAGSEVQPGEPVEKIRRRVEKNVANEIHQIEEKVERELAEAVAGAEPEPEPIDLLAAAREESTAELLEDIIPDITPPPAEAPVYAPIFVAPAAPATADTADEDASEDADPAELSAEEQARERSARRRRGRRGTGRGRGAEAEQSEAEEPAQEEKAEPEPQEKELPTEPVGIRGSTRLEAQRRRRTEMREEGRKKRHVVSTQEFLERRESMERRMIVRERQRLDHPGLVTQVGVLEDDQLVEQFVTSDSQNSMVGNIYLGRVQNVLPSMEAAFIDIGKGRNGVLYAGEVDWKAAGLGGRGRRIEQALKSGDQVLVQVSKDPVGHKGARLTTQISLAGRYLVYVPGGRSAGISRKLPGPERKRLKEILGRVVPAQGGTIIRTAAEGVSEENIAADVNRLHTLWEQIQERTEQEKHSRGSRPVTMYEEPDMLVKVIRDLFNEDFTSLIVDGERAWNTVRAYIQSVAPDLVSRVEHFDRADYEGKDAFEAFDLNTQIQEALSRKVNLPSGGSLVIDRTEAMTVIDVNTGRYTGKGVGNLEETVTLNNIEAAEEIVRQMRLRDLGGMIVVDFIDMVLPENQELVLRRLNEALENDRTRHQVSEVTSLGLVQMTRKRLGAGLLETFSTECEVCAGRGVVVHDDPVEHVDARVEAKAEERSRRHRREKEQAEDRHPAQHPMVVAMQDLVEDESHDLDQEFEELAASVILLDDAPETEQEEPEETPELAESTVTPEEGPRRRARRRRQASHEESVAEPADLGAEDILAIVSAAVEIADDEDPDEPSGSSYVSDFVAETAEEPAVAPVERRRRRGKTRTAPEAAADLKAEVAVAGTSGVPETGSYEEALAEFEASPRRRRATRGNSRSDIAPKPEDFHGAHPEPATADAAESAPEPERGSRRRRSRGSAAGDTRRTGPVQAPELSERTEPTVEVEQPAAAPRRNRPSEVGSGAPARTRRRVVQRRNEPAAARPEVAPRTAPPAEPVAAPGVVEPDTGGRRRRRRVVRAGVEPAPETATRTGRGVDKAPAAAEPEESGHREKKVEQDNSGRRRRRATRSRTRD